MRDSTHQYNTQNSLLQKNLTTFYEKDGNLRKMLDIITGVSPISLRIVDWFTTNYSNRYSTSYNIGLDNDIDMDNRIFRVHTDYKLKLKSYSKRRFDPFCRWSRIEFPYDENEERMCIETTIGQMNFFKWALENHVIEHIQNNYGEIERDMIVHSRTMSNRKDANPTTKTRRKRRMTSTTNKGIQKESQDTVLSFK